MHPVPEATVTHFRLGSFGFGSSLAFEELGWDDLSYLDEKLSFPNGILPWEITCPKYQSFPTTHYEEQVSDRDIRCQHSVLATSVRTEVRAKHTAPN
jgi:hypothetical protein